MNQNLNIMLIEDDPAVCKRFTEQIDAIADISITAITNNSYRALELIKDDTPDVVILDLELNQGQGNGLVFLKDLNKLTLPLKPYILITTNNSSSVTYDCARQLGADFIMSKQQADYSEKTVIHFLKILKNIIQNQQTDGTDFGTSNYQEKHIVRLINQELEKIGISPGVIGHKYLIDAILLAINGHTKNLGIILGEKYNKTNTSVERAMHNAIKNAWRSMDIDELHKYYTAKITSKIGVPTLTEFIHYYANKINNNL